MIEVGIVGYGTIGKRVADAVREQPDMCVAGVAKRTPNHEARTATDRGYPLHAADADYRREFERADLTLAGDLDDLLQTSEVIVDATPAGVGAANRERYEHYDVPVIYQGGEDADVAETSFCARANYADATSADSVRVVSCNTTSLARLFAPLEETFGIERATVMLVRRGGDPDQTDRGPINDIVPDPVTIPSHHGPDLERVIPSLSVETMGLTVPATLMHVQGVDVSLETAATEADVRAVLAEESRVRLLPSKLAINGCGALREMALNHGRPRGDLWENCVWEESIHVDGNRLKLFQAVHQEADVVPENIDAIRAITGAADGVTSCERTNQSLGLE